MTKHNENTDFMTRNQRQDEIDLTLLRDLFAEKDETTEYVIDNLLPKGGLSIFAAKPKVGKSTLARNAAKAVSRGEQFLNRNTICGPVIYLALEEKRSEVKRHFKDIGCTGDEKIHLMTSVAPSLAVLCAMAAKIKPEMIIIDPLFRFIRVPDTNSYGKMLLALDPLLRFSRDSGIHVIAVHHLGKSRQSGIDAILGSTAIVGTFDTVLVMRRTEQYRTIETIQRYGTDMEESVLDFDDATRVVTLGELRQVEEQTRVGKSIEEYLNRHKSGATEAAVTEEVGGRAQVRKRSLRRLVEEGRIERTGAGTRGDPYNYKIVSAFQPDDGNQGTRNGNEGQNIEKQSNNSGSQVDGKGDSGSHPEDGPQ
jgi:predicted ATP-dependent serine protease